MTVSDLIVISSVAERSFNKIVMGNYFTYITTNPAKEVLYVGVTNGLHTRLLQHFNNRGKSDSFAGRYYCYKLIYFERHLTPEAAIEREKQLKEME